MSQERVLAAIMFTDIVGYTALMGKDSNKALELIRISKEIQKPLVEKHNGKWLKEMGDGAMAQFSTALDAVNCSIEIQKTARGELDAKLRIGIHLGDVTVEDDDVYGDGVNVASRLESIADPGGIYISESIEKAIQGQSDVQGKYLGEVKLKNVAYGVRTYALQGVGLPIPEVKDEKELSGHFLAELQRRGVLRAGATYVVLSLLLILLVPYVRQLIELPQWFPTALFTLLTVGLPLALYFAWNYERSPEGFVRTTSRESWQNPYSATRRKPLTSNFIIAGLVVAIIAMFVYPRYFPQDPVISDKSIAVLPFSDMSPNKDQEYLGDGIAEEILNVLAKFEGLKVIGRTSSFSYKGKDTDLKTIGKELGVATILEGSVQKDENQIRITAQLINATDGSHIWSDSYDRELKSIFKIQDEISQSIGEAMKLSLGLVERNPVDLEVYDLHLRVRTLLNQRGPGIASAIALLDQIIDMDSMYQPAWTDLARAWIVFPSYQQLQVTVSREEFVNRHKVALERAEYAAMKSLSLNSQDPVAVAAIATIYRIRHDWSTAHEYYQRAIMLNEQSPVILEDYVQFLLNVGYARKSMEFAERMIDLNPLTPLYLNVYAHALESNNRYQESLEALKKAIRIDPNSYVSIRKLIWTYLNLNHLDSALDAAQLYNLPQNWRDDYIAQIEAVRHDDANFDFDISHHLYFALNELDELDTLMSRLQQQAEFGLGIGYASVINPHGLTLHSEKFLDDPRFKEIVKTSGLLDFWKEYGWPDRCKPIEDDDFVCE